jgi:hypothetical protein
MEINEHILKISSAGVSLPEALVLGRRYLIRTEAGITDIIERDNQNGTVDKIYKARQTGNVELLDEGKRIIKAEGKKKVSQSIHGAVWYYWNETGPGVPFDEYYERIGKKIAYYIPDIIRFLENKQ